MDKLELNYGNFTVLKVIEINDINKFQYFSGFLYYQRQLTKEYDEKTPDFLDDMILNAIKASYPDARFTFSRNMLFKGQLEDTLLRFYGKEDLEFKITFMPYIPFDKYDVVNSMGIYCYTKKISLRYNSVTNANIELYVNTHVQAEIPFDQIEEFNSKIESVIFQ